MKNLPIDIQQKIYKIIMEKTLFLIEHEIEYHENGDLKSEVLFENL
jgi:hypothetical protein